MLFLFVALLQWGVRASLRKGHDAHIVVQLHKAKRIGLHPIDQTMTFIVGLN